MAKVDNNKQTNINFKNFVLKIKTQINAQNDEIIAKINKLSLKFSDTKTNVAKEIATISDKTHATTGLKFTIFFIYSHYTINKINFLYFFLIL